jgi:hypothetical protein
MVTSDSTDLPEGYTDDGTETIGTETPFDLSTGGQLEDEKPTEKQQHIEEKEVSLSEKSADEVISNAHPGEEDPQKQFRSLNREKRQIRKEEEDESSHQHLDHDSNPDDIESSRLPVEHRGMGDMEDDDHDHSHNSSALLFSNVALTLSTLLLFYLSF